MCVCVCCVLIENFVRLRIYNLEKSRLYITKTSILSSFYFETVKGLSPIMVKLKMRSRYDTLRMKTQRLVFKARYLQPRATIGQFFKYSKHVIISTIYDK